MNKNTQNTRAQLNDGMTQIQNLLKPVTDEDQRLDSIAGDLIKNNDAIIKDTNDKMDLSLDLSSEARQAKMELENLNKQNEVNDMMK